MSKIVLFTPDSRMQETARGFVSAQKLDIDCIEVAHTDETLREARIAVERGAHIIIARGYQAKLIKDYTRIPVVDIRFHAQEIGLLIQKAKGLLGNEHPHIALVLFDNMLCDMTHMSELFGVRLSILYLERLEDAESMLSGMGEDRPDIVIGGEYVCRIAEKMGMPDLYYHSTEESISEAIYTATRMLYAAEEEEISHAQFDAILDVSAGAIVKINAEGKIIAANRRMTQLLQKSAESITGSPFGEWFREPGDEIIREILAGTRDNYVTTTNIRNSSYICSVSSIRYENQITGAILSFARTETLGQQRSHLQKTLMGGFSSAATFSDIRTVCENMKETLEQARKYALSERPVLIYGDEGTEYFMIAQAIHNNSRRKSFPFVSVDVAGLDGEQQSRLLFGAGAQEYDRESLGGTLHQANHGTLFIEHMDELSMQVQNRLYYGLLRRSSHRLSAQENDYLEVRVIGAARSNLLYQVREKKFSEKLFFSIQGLTLEVPPLSARQEDLYEAFTQYFKYYCSKYNKPLSLTDSALRELRGFSWPGNLIQLDAFCERLVLDSDRSRINEVALKRLYAALYPRIQTVGNRDSVVIYKSPEAVELGELLEKYHGNRALAAKELGVSPTTLWRRMKKYGIEASFSR